VSKRLTVIIYTSSFPEHTSIIEGGNAAQPGNTCHVQSHERDIWPPQVMFAPAICSETWQTYYGTGCEAHQSACSWHVVLPTACFTLTRRKKKKRLFQKEA